MHLLVLSDIHNNIEHVRLLRGQEENIYDAIIIGGDIGDEGMVQEFFSIIDSFSCPAYCVYGNWDNGLEYKPILSKNCRLIHHNIENIGGLYLAGFSGCPSGWGINPIYLAEKSQIEFKHREILEQIAATWLELKQYPVVGAKRIVLHDVKTSPQHGGPKSAHNKDELREARRLQAIIRKSENSKEYRSYLKDRDKMFISVLTKNRSQLFNNIKKSNIPQNKLIILTHQRMPKLAEEGINPLLHIFGHLHEYSFNKYKETYYLNASAIDNGFSEFFGKQKLCPEGYCRVTINDDTEVSVERRLLPVSSH